MFTQATKLLATLVMTFAVMTKVSFSWAQDYTGAVDCCSMTGTVISGACIRPALPATISVGIILVEFTDRAHFSGATRPNGYLKPDYENMLFSDNSYLDPQDHPDNENVYGSLKDWYQENSHGLIQITGQVVNAADANGVLTWINLGNKSGYENNERKMAIDGITAAVGNGWNCNYNVLAVVGPQNQINGSVTPPVPGLSRGRAYHGSTNFGCSSNLRIQASELPSGSPHFNYSNFMGAYTTAEQWDGDISGAPVTFRHIGIHAHELFHVLGFVFLGIWQDQDKIDTGFATGDWSMMHRNDAGPKRKGESVAHLSAARKISTGWATATNITANNMAENIQYIVTQTDIPNPTDFYKFTDTASGEEFVIENRQYSSFNSFLPGWWDPAAVKGGLLVFNTKPYATINGNDRSVERIRLGDNAMAAPYNTGSGDPTFIWSVGDPGDPFPGGTSNNKFTMASLPNSNRRSGLPPSDLGGDPTGFAITNISASATTMTATFHKSYLASNSADAIASNSSRKLARDSGGNYHLVFETGGELYYQKSTDGGSTWSSYIRLSAGNGSNKFPCIAERSGKLYVFWQRKTGTNTYATHFRHHNGASWETLRTVNGSITSSNDLTPVLAVSTPSASFEMMVVYRTNSGLRFRRSTSGNGASWEAAADVTTNTSARNPSLIYKANDYGYLNVTWDDGSNIKHQIYYGGTTWGAATTVSNGTSAYNHQYSSYALSANNDRHIVWQAFEAVDYQKQAIYHNKNLTNVFTVFASANWDHLKPSGTGHTNGTFTALCYDGNNNVRKRYYNGSYWQGGSEGTVIASNGLEASASIANPPGAVAKAVWRSSGSVPYTLTVGPSGGLSKSNADENWVYQRRVVFSSNNSATFALQMGAPQLHSSSSTSEQAFPVISDQDSIKINDLAAALELSNVALPADADSLAFEVKIYGQDAGSLRNDQTRALNLTFDLLSVETGLPLASIQLSPPNNTGVSRQSARAVFPVQALRGRQVHLLPRVSNLSLAKVEGALVHVYEVTEGGAQKANTELPSLVATTQPVSFAVQVSPNPFNPSTQIYFHLPSEGLVAVRVYDVNGRIVKELFNGFRSAGEHSVTWDGRDELRRNVASGMYFSEVNIGEQRKIAKMMLVR